MFNTIDRDNGTSSLRTKLILAAFAGIAAFFLLAEHRAHVIPLLPWLLLAVCPLMHVFKHRGHGRGHGHADRAVHGSSRRPPSAPDAEDPRAGAGAT